MANKVRTLRQSFGTGGSQPDLSGITHRIESVMFVPVNADAVEMNSDPGTDDWVELGSGKVYNADQLQDDFPSLRAKSDTENVDLHVEVKRY